MSATLTFVVCFALLTQGGAQGPDTTALLQGTIQIAQPDLMPPPQPDIQLPPLPDVLPVEKMDKSEEPQPDDLSPSDDSSSQLDSGKRLAAGTQYRSGVRHMRAMPRLDNVLKTMAGVTESGQYLSMLAEAFHSTAFLEAMDKEAFKLITDAATSLARDQSDLDKLIEDHTDIREKMKIIKAMQAFLTRERLAFGDKIPEVAETIMKALPTNMRARVEGRNLANLLQSDPIDEALAAFQRTTTMNFCHDFAKLMKILERRREKNGLSNMELEQTEVWHLGTFWNLVSGSTRDQAMVSIGDMFEAFRTLYEDNQRHFASMETGLTLLAKTKLNCNWKTEPVPEIKSSEEGPVWVTVNQASHWSETH